MKLHIRRHLAITLTLAVVASASASVVGPRDDATRPVVEKFLSRPFVATQYQAMRHLEASGSGQRGWLDARTEFTPEAGMRYEITAEGGSGLIRSRILRSLLQQEKELIASGSSGSVAIDASNYTFPVSGADRDGLIRVTIQPLRQHRALIAGAMFLTAEHGELVRVEGRLAKNPSFWLRKVDIVRSYATINDVLVPVSLQSTAQVRFLGGSSLRMTYDYSEVGHRAASSP